MITCTFENGGTGNLRHVTVNAIVLKDNKVLLGKRGTHNGKPMTEFGKWGLLGGYLGLNENLIQGVTREVMEESGWEIKDVKFIKIFDEPIRHNDDKQNVNITFSATAVKQVSTHDEEVTELRWFDLNDLPPSDEIAFDHENILKFYYTTFSKISC